MDLILIGRSGNGKSSTGNSILGRERFQKNNDSFAKSSKPQSASQMIDDGNQRVTLTVVDGLCLNLDSLQECVRDALEALRLGNNGFTALVFVLRFGERFSADEVSLVQRARRVFGESVVRDHGICVVTRGDDFAYAIAEGEETVENFTEWCRKQTGELKSLFNECQGRVVLFDNKTKLEKEKHTQVKELLNCVVRIQGHGGRRYTRNDFSRIHGKHVETDPRKNSTEFERKTHEKIRELGVRVDEYLKDGSLADEEVASALREELKKLSESVSQTLQDKELELKFIQQIQDLWQKVKEKRSSHHSTGKGGTPMSHSVHTQSAQSQSVQPHIAGETAQHPLDKFSPQPYSLQLLLLGRTGNGKSSTGNSILGRPAFKPSASTTSATTEVLSDSETIDGQLITVIDGPGLDDTEKTSMEDFMASLASVEKALDLCDYGFSAIIVVLRFGFRFTKQESDAIRVMRSVLGRNVLKKYGVCLMTHGDNFEYEMTQDAEEGGAVSFREWCQAQTGDIQQLFEECNFRYVLFNNKTRDQGKMAEQRRQLLSLVPTGGCYSKEEFLACERDLVELNLEVILPKLEEKTNEKLEECRGRMLKIDRDSGTDDSEYFKQMKSLLTNVTELKDAIAALGHNDSTNFFIMQLNVLEVEINTKIKLRAQNKDMKSMGATTAGQAPPEREPAPQGSAAQFGHGNEPWASQWQGSSLGTGAAAQGYGAHQGPQHAGLGNAVSMETRKPTRTREPTDVLRDERNGIKMELQKIYAAFVDVQETQPSVNIFIRETKTTLMKLDKLEEFFKEIAIGKSYFDEVNTELSTVKDELNLKLAQAMQSGVSYGQSGVSYGQSGVSYGQSARIYGQSAGSYGQRAGIYEQSAGIYRQHAGSYGQSAEKDLVYPYPTGHQVQKKGFDKNSGLERIYPDSVVPVNHHDRRSCTGGSKKHKKWKKPIVEKWKKVKSILKYLKKEFKL